jgi:hypothetical protein
LFCSSDSTATAKEEDEEEDEDEEDEEDDEEFIAVTLDGSGGSSSSALTRTPLGPGGTPLSLSIKSNKFVRTPNDTGSVPFNLPGTPNDISAINTAARARIGILIHISRALLCCYVADSDA